MYKEIHEEDSPSISIEELFILLGIFGENGAKAIFLHEERIMDSMDAIMDTNSSVYEEGNKFIVEYPDCVFVKNSVPPDPAALWR